ncbi:MAG: hypothetical protein PHE38_14320 [Alishewanella agri]|nr:hypothetical protein [Alishewanella agri]
MMYQENLYINHSTGKAGSWAISVTDNGDNTATITTTACKVLGGKPVVTTEIVREGKNIGRANETSPLEQAIAEAKSKAQKKIDKGYTHNIPEEGQKAVNSLGLTKPMLAQEFKAVTEWPVYVQPKLDGNRCLAARVDGKIMLWSRGGKEINLPHIAQTLDAFLPEGIILDGELYVHGQTLQTITSWIKKLQPQSFQIQYMVYDCVDSECFSVRKQLTRRILPVGTGVEWLQTFEVHDEEQLQHYHNTWVGKGYEGTMVRTLGVGYEDGKRSKSLQKMKDFQDSEFEILDVIQGTPRQTATGQLEVPIYVCKCGPHTFNATAPGDMFEKHSAWLNRDNAIGKMLTVKFFSFTPDGIPFLPVALRIREDI